MASDLLDRLRARLEAAADPERAEGAAAYMRNQFAFYGIRSPELTVIVRDVTSGLPAPDEQALAAFALDAWARPEREWQYVACGYLRRHVNVASADLLPTVRVLIQTKSWWDTVDTLASHTVGPLVRKHPELVAEMDRWIADEDFWVSRTAILHQLSAKDATDAERLFRYCAMRARDTEFFTRKAIGWALREYSKRDEPAVRAFVDDHPELSGLSKREALKWLERRAARPALQE